MRPPAELLHESEEMCVEECAPALEHQRGLCDEKFIMSRCLSTLTCDERAAYEWVVDNANYEVLYDTEYPCKPEVLDYIEVCS